MNQFIELCMNLILVLIIGAIVVLFWQALEFLITGVIEINKVDNIIAIILSYSLYFNLKYFDSKEVEDE